VKGGGGGGDDEIMYHRSYWCLMALYAAGPQARVSYVVNHTCFICSGTHWPFESIHHPLGDDLACRH
jgi:hypothetical protein